MMARFAARRGVGTTLVAAATTPSTPLADDRLCTRDIPRAACPEPAAAGRSGFAGLEGNPRVASIKPGVSLTAGR